MLFRKNAQMVDAADALAGRTDQTMPVPDTHFVNGHLPVSYTHLTLPTTPYV